MTTIGTAIGLFGNALLAVAAITSLFKRWTLSPALRLLLAATVLLAALVPIAGLPLAAYLRGVFGDLSVTTLCLLTAAMASRISGRAMIPSEEQNAIHTVVLVAAAVLYPLALGLGYFDPYALGYGSLYFAGVLFVIALAAWFAHRYLLALCIILAILAYAHDLLDSRNLWDYLVDPLLVFYALFAQTRQALRAVRHRRARGQSSGTGGRA